MRILGIETSCDETSIGIVEDGFQVLANVTASQQEFHEKYGGVVPEVAARRHLEVLSHVTREALTQSGLSFAQIDGIAVTYAPGLATALLTGLQFAKGLSMALSLPWIGVNHLEGHIFANFLNQPQTQIQDAYPFLSLLVSGAHTMLVLAEREGEYTTLGSTLDDAVGEAFDKVGRYLDLPFPGGPAIDRLAARGDPEKVRFPHSVPERPYEFSYSGLKTAVVRFVEKYGREGQMNGTRFTFPDLLAGFQSAAVDILAKKTIAAAIEKKISTITVGGGVAANSRLRSEMERRGNAAGLKIIFPSLECCTDNGAMIASAGSYRLQRGERSPWNLGPVSRLPLATHSR